MWTNNGHLQAIDAINGEQIWLYEVGNSHPNYNERITSPTVVGGILYASLDTERLSALDTANGELLWRTSLIEGSIVYSPVVTNGVVAFSARFEGRPYLYGFDAITGDPMWRRKGIEHYVPEGRGYYAQNYLISKHDVIYVWPFAALDAVTGEQIPSFDGFHPNAISNVSPVFDSCIMYGKGISTGIDKYSYVFASDAVTGKSIWEFPYPSSGPVLGDNGIVYISRGNQLSAVEFTTPEVIWDYEILAKPVSVLNSGAIAYSGGILYIPTDRGLYALDTSTQELLWRTDDHYGYSPKVFNGIVYLTTLGGIAAVKAESPR